MVIPSGLLDAVHDTQQTFRVLLNALAYPGQIQTIPIHLSEPDELSSACAAACLTLFDLETHIWVSGISEVSRQWLVFHTGCQFTEQPEAADFALVVLAAGLPDLGCFNWGHGESPESSATLLLVTEGLTGGSPKTLKGPGIAEHIRVTPRVPDRFWSQWCQNQQAYPLGIDAYLFGGASCIGLPRTVAVLETSP